MNKSCMFTFGRFNPPHIMHERLIDSLFDYSGFWGALEGIDRKVFVSVKEHDLKNPLSLDRKKYWLKESFKRQMQDIEFICDDHICKDLFTVLGHIYKLGYDEIFCVFGSDRIDDIIRITDNYNGKDMLENGRYFNFQNINVIDFNRDEIINPVSGSQQRAYVAENDFLGFAENCPKSLNEIEQRMMFDEIKENLLKEENYEDL